MRKTECTECSESFAFGETYQVLGRTSCAACGEKILAEHGHDNIQEGDIIRNVDSTVCVWCNADGGTTEHQLLVASQPTCEPCNTRMRNWPYPVWVKLSFAFLVLLAIAAFIYNYRFVDSLVAVRQAKRAANRGDVARAADLWERAARQIPEERSLASIAQLYRGIALLAEDRCQEAVDKLQAYMQTAPQDTAVKNYLLHAEIGASYDRKDYQTMLQKAQELQAAKPTEGQTAMMVASAAACVYANTGEGSDLATADEWIKKAREIGFNGPPADEYEDRIRHRLATRQIVKKADFEKQFPNGWKRGQQP